MCICRSLSISFLDIHTKHTFTQVYLFSTKVQVIYENTMMMALQRRRQWRRQRRLRRLYRIIYNNKQMVGMVCGGGRHLIDGISYRVIMQSQQQDYAHSLQYICVWLSGCCCSGLCFSFISFTSQLMFYYKLYERYKAR